jgi:tetratricopeptide (TPR) repeat protein
MQQFPEYIRDIYSTKNLVPPAEKAQLILDFIPTHDEDKDYLQAWAISAMRQSENKELVIHNALDFLMHVKTPDCRRYIQGALIEAYEETHQNDKALTTMIERAEEDSFNGLDFKDIALEYKKKNDLPNAILYYERFLAVQTNAEAADYAEIAELYNTKRDFKNAAKYFIAAGQEESQNADYYWQNVGRALAIDGQEEEALFYFKMAYTVNPEDDWAHYYTGEVYKNKKDVPQALFHYAEVLKINPDFAAVYDHLSAIASNGESDITGAIEDVEKEWTLRYDKRVLTLYRNLSVLYKEIGDYDKQDYYRRKLMETAGFPLDFDLEDDEETENV